MPPSLPDDREGLRSDAGAKKEALKAKDPRALAKVKCINLVVSDQLTSGYGSRTLPLRQSDWFSSAECTFGECL
jgi:hypothetical protein